MTWAPSAAERRAIAAPKPLLAPVTNMVVTDACPLCRKRVEKRVQRSVEVVGPLQVGQVRGPRDDRQRRSRDAFAHELDVGDRRELVVPTDHDEGRHGDPREHLFVVGALGAPAQHDTPDPKVIEQVGDVAGERAQRRRARHHRALAVAAKVRCDHPPARSAEPFDLRSPHRPVEGVAVHQHERVACSGVVVADGDPDA
jgi:hypothetical protein